MVKNPTQAGNWIETLRRACASETSAISKGCSQVPSGSVVLLPGCSQVIFPMWWGKVKKFGSESQVHPYSIGSSGKKTATNFWEEISEASVGHSTRVEQSLKQFQGFGGRMPSVYYSQGWKTMKNLKRRLSLPMSLAPLSRSRPQVNNLKFWAQQSSILFYLELYFAPTPNYLWPCRIAASTSFHMLSQRQCLRQEPVTQLPERSRALVIEQAVPPREWVWIRHGECWCVSIVH